MARLRVHDPWFRDYTHHAELPDEALTIIREALALYRARVGVLTRFRAL
jgi:hypothetical protein